ncbi:MAG: hypothetical protein QNJ62_01160 [Methyloceanibacter sp.]|nr:hypothetical protein [Methyloceanibacter sp.]
MILAKKKEPTVTSPEIQEDVSRDAIATTFQNAMASHLRSHVPGTNINEQTFLASDYLNQFHELVMLLEALPVDPSTFASDLHQWNALDYEEHFSRSKLSNKDLAIAAYRRAPANVRDKFDSAVARLQGEALRLVAAVGQSLDSQNDLAMTCSGATSRLRVLIDDANAIANGHPSADDEGKDVRPSQITIDTLFRLRKR